MLLILGLLGINSNSQSRCPASCHYFDCFNFDPAHTGVQMPVFRAIRQWMAGQPAASPGLLYNLLMMVRLEHLQGDALHLLLQDELVRADVQCSQLVAHAALQIAGTATDHFPCRPVRSLAQVQVQVGIVYDSDKLFH